MIARLQWLDATGKVLNHTVRPPEYPLDVTREGGWTKMELTATAPENGVAVDVQLSLGFDPDGVVWWDEVAMVEIDHFRLHSPHGPQLLVTALIDRLVARGANERERFE